MVLQALPFNVASRIFGKVRKKRVCRKLRGPDSPLYNVIWPMIYIVRVFGFAPYNFSQDRLVPSNINLIFTAIAAILYSWMSYEVFKRFLNVTRETWTLGRTENAKVAINYSVVMYELGLVAFTRNSFASIWNALQDYDESVRQLGYPRKEKRTAILAWILVIVSAIIWIIVNRSGMHAFSERWTVNVGYMIPYIGTSVAIYKFVAMAIFLGQRFHHLSMIATKNLPSTWTEEGSGTIISKKTILSLHDDLMIASENLESLYSLSLLFWLGNLTLHLVSNIFFLIEWMIVKKLEVESWPLVSCFCTWLLAFFFQLLLLSLACDFASSQANCIAPILIEWQVRLMKKNEDVELSLQFLTRTLRFSAGGCFYVNLPLLRSIASLMTTYLVILLQLQ